MPVKRKHNPKLTPQGKGAGEKKMIPCPFNKQCKFKKECKLYDEESDICNSDVHARNYYGFGRACGCYRDKLKEETNHANTRTN